MITILITAILLIVHSQIIASCHISNAALTDSSLTNKRKIVRHLLSVLDWPFCITVNLLFITNKKYRRNVIISISSVIICSLSIIALRNQIEGVPVKSLLQILSFSIGVWWLLDYIIGGLVEGYRNGTLFED